MTIGRRKLLFCLVAPIALTPAIPASAPGCVHPSTDGLKPQRFDGLYRQAFEQSLFYPDSGGGPYWMDYSESVGLELHRHLRRKTGQRGSHITVRLTVEGSLESVGSFGHLGRYDMRLTATRLLSIAPIKESVLFERAARADGPPEDDEDYDD